MKIVLKRDGRKDLLLFEGEEAESLLERLKEAATPDCGHTECGMNFPWMKQLEEEEKNPQCPCTTGNGRRCILRIGHTGTHLIF